MRMKIDPFDEHNRFHEEVEKRSGQKISNCYQCSKCGGTCNICPETDLTPRQVIEYTLDGLREMVFNSRTIWGCGNCSECYINCPAGFKINELMTTIRDMAIEASVPPNLTEIDRIYEKDMLPCAKRARAEMLEKLAQESNENH